MVELVRALWAELTPFGAVISAIVGANVIIIGLLIRLMSVMRNASQAQIDAIKVAHSEQKELFEQRLAWQREQLTQTEKRSEYEKSHLKDQIAQLKDALDRGGYSARNLASPHLQSGETAQIGSHVPTKIRRLVGNIENAASHAGSFKDPQWHWELARAHMASQQWDEAAFHLDIYCELLPDEYEGQFLRGVAHANKRGGLNDNVLALEAYDAAIEHSPDDWEAKGRALTYKGAMLKRLNRLDDAEAALLRARDFIKDLYDRVDNNYNLACIYAMKLNRTRLLAAVRELRQAPAYFGAYSGLIRAHMDDYFSNFRTDKEFIELVTH